MVFARSQIHILRVQARQQQLTWTRQVFRPRPSRGEWLVVEFVSRAYDIPN